MDQSSVIEEGVDMNPFHQLPEHIIDAILQHLDLYSCLALASYGPYLESRVRSIPPTRYIIVLIPTRNGQIIDKWQVVKNEYNPRWTLKMPLDQEETSLHLIKELFRLVPDVQAIRITDYDLVDMVLKFGRKNSGLFSSLRLFEYQDTINLSDKRSEDLFEQIKREIPNLGKVRNIRHYSAPHGFMACYRVYEDLPQF